MRMIDPSCFTNVCICLFAMAGAGKGEQVKHWAPFFQKRLGLKVKILAMSKILADRVKVGDEISQRIDLAMKQGVQVPDDIVVDLVANFVESLDAGDLVICDGFPRNPNQIKIWCRFFRSFRKVVVELQLTAEEAKKRADRRAKKIWRVDNDPRVVEKRLKEYLQFRNQMMMEFENQSVPVLPINAVPSIALVCRASVHQMHNHLMLPASRHGQGQVAV